MEWPVFEQDEIDAAAAVLKSGKVNYWTGTHGADFEREFAAYCGASYGVALANGTVALEASLRALGIGPGTDVVVPARSFFASASCVVACGARPLFADVDPDSQNVTVDTIDATVSQRTRAVIVVHLAGWPCDMHSIREYCRVRNLRLVEDCAQAHGAHVGGQRVGSFGDAAAFSFCNDKIMSTAGEGGMLLTGDSDTWRAAWSYKDHGKDWDAIHATRDTPGFSWVHSSFGTNWRMTEIQAAIGRTQLRKLPLWLEARRSNALQFLELLGKESCLRIPWPAQDIGHAWYKFGVFVRPEVLRSSWDRDRILAAAQERGIACYSGSCPEIYMERAFDDSDVRPEERLRVARALGESSLMLKVDPCQTPEHVELHAGVLKDILRRAQR